MIAAALRLAANRSEIQAMLDARKHPSDFDLNRMAALIREEDAALREYREAKGSL